jgi:hypothetical protein
MAEIGMAAGRCNAYDVWSDTPLADVTGALAVRLEPHAVRVVALRPAAAYPQVIGTSRHVVQGAVDLTAERWDPATRMLQGMSVNLDRRAYAITIAVPPALQPVEATADPPCTLTRLPSGHAAIAWPEGTGGRDVAWTVRFR